MTQKASPINLTALARILALKIAAPYLDSLPKDYELPKPFTTFQYSISPNMPGASMRCSAISDHFKVSFYIKHSEQEQGAAVHIDISRPGTRKSLTLNTLIRITPEAAHIMQTEPAAVVRVFAAALYMAAVRLQGELNAL